MLILKGMVTWDLNAVDYGLFDAVEECKHVGHFRCRHVLSFPSVKKDSQFKPSCSWLKKETFPPVGVSDAIAEVEETLSVDGEQVAGVEVHVSFLVDVVQLLLLRLQLISLVAREWRLWRYFTHQESRFT